jgi:hypothetical protein
MPVPLPSFADLPHRWKRADALAVLAAVDASGLSPTDFAHATGVDVRRIWRWRERLQAERPPRPARSRPAPSGPIRLVELVAHTSSAVQPVATSAAPANPLVERVASLPIAAVPDPPMLPVPPCPLIDVTAPGGWQLRVPGALLAALVHALSERSC